MKKPLRLSQAIKDEWEEKLKDSGFVDIEEEKRGERVLRQNASNCYRGAPEVVRRTKFEYFQVVGAKINETIFLKESEKYIMQMYCEGIKQIEICRRMRRSRWPIYRVIRRYLTQWGLK